MSNLTYYERALKAESDNDRLRGQIRECLETNAILQKENERLSTDRARLLHDVGAMTTRQMRLEAKNERLKEQNKDLQKQNYIQKLNLQLRTIDGSMDEHELIEDAERYRLIRRNVTPAQLVANGLRDGGDLAPSETIGARIDWMVDEAIAARGNDE